MLKKKNRLGQFFPNHDQGQAEGEFKPLLDFQNPLEHVKQFDLVVRKGFSI